MNVSKWLVLLLLLSGCTARTPSSAKQGSVGDTLHAADSTVVAPVPDTELTMTYEQRQGKYLFAEYCAVCHGDDGKGDGFNAYNLDPRPRDFTDSTYMRALGDQQTFATINGGGRSVNKSALMPPYGWTLQKEEIRYIVAYVKTFFSAKPHEGG